MKKSLFRLLSVLLILVILLPAGVFADDDPPTAYKVEIQAENGTVSADKESCAAGETVVLTLTPDSGKSLEELRLTGAGSHKEIKVKKTGPAEYSFIMPSENVTVKCRFNRTFDAVLDFGEEHKLLAKSFADTLLFPVSGSRVTLTVGSGPTVGSVREVLALLLKQTLAEEKKDLFDGGERMEGRVGLKPMSAYTGENAYDEEKALFPTEDETDPAAACRVYYVFWQKEVSAAVLTVVPPQCGTEVHYGTDTEGRWRTLPEPEMSVTGGVHFQNTDTHFIDWSIEGLDGSGSAPVTLTGGNYYGAHGYLEADWGYYLPKDPAAALKVEGASLVSFSAADGRFTVSVSVEHTFASETVVVPATCTEEGSETRHCTLCGADVTEAIPALGHDLGEAVVLPATCTEEGSETRHCSRCGADVTEAIPALGHDLGEAVVVPATCTEEGSETRHCDRCGADVTEAVPALGHELGEAVVVPATCTGEGSETRHCSRCGADVTEAVPALGHDWGEADYVWSADLSEVTATRVCSRDASHIETETVKTTSKVTKAPTASATGERTYTTAAFANTAFSVQTKTETMPLHPQHQVPANAVTVAPTCTEKGSKTYHCPVCDQDVTESIDALGHSWGAVTYRWSGDLSTVTATRTCSRNASHVETETVRTTSRVTRAATQASPGQRTYTATFSNKAFATQTKTEAFAAPGGGGGQGAAVTTYIISFRTNGGSAVAIQTVTRGNTARKPVDPIKNGYEFTGWFTDPACLSPFDFRTAITADTVLYAGWKIKGNDSQTDVPAETANPEETAAPPDSENTPSPVEVPEEEPPRSSGATGSVPTALIVLPVFGLTTLGLTLFIRRQLGRRRE